MADVFALKVLTPAGLLFEEPVREVSLPSSQGEIGFLPDHTHYAGVLGVGVMTFITASGEIRKIVVSGGFASFGENQLQILADSADTKESIDATKLAKLGSDAQKQLDGIDGYNDLWPVYRAKVDRVEAMNRLVQS